ncbi:hypothetical protein [Trichothermofontia sp.]
MTDATTDRTQQSKRDRLPSQRQCVTAGGDTIFFIYPNGHITPDAIAQTGEPSLGEDKALMDD